MLLTDKDIRKYFKKDIIIEPFLSGNLSPIGYNFSIGDFVFSLESGIISLTENKYIIPPFNTVQILTKEALWVSNRIAGTFHSKVKLVSRGFSHISTTLDPGWVGPLLITMRNNTKEELELGVDETFVTLLFYKVRTPSKTMHDNPPFRLDILSGQLDRNKILRDVESKSNQYLKKVIKIYQDKNAEIIPKIEYTIKEANRPIVAKIVSSIRKNNVKNIFRNIGRYLLYLGIGFLIILHFIWDSVNPIFKKIPYDSKIFAVQVTGIVALFALLISLKKRD